MLWCDVFRGRHGSGYCPNPFTDQGVYNLRDVCDPTCHVPELRAQRSGVPSQAQGFRADVAQYGAVLGVLLDCGVLPAQLKAMQLFQVAARQGLLRCGGPCSGL